MATEDFVATVNNADNNGADLREISRGMDADNAANDGKARTTGGGFGTTAKLSAPVDRGMSSFLPHLQYTSKIRDHSMKEEMHGRTKQAHYEEEEHNNQMVAGGRGGRKTMVGGQQGG